jgi:hypothetical protein
LTLPENVPTQKPEPVPNVDHAYVIDPSRAESLHRSLAALLASRRCSSCRERLQGQEETISVEEHLSQIEECCSKQEGFIRPEMPMQEILFRILLAGGNSPVPLSHLHHEVTETWYTPTNPRGISAASLKRVLDSDSFYGFKVVQPASP